MTNDLLVLHIDCSNDEVVRKETVVAYFKVQTQNLLGRTLNTGVCSRVSNPEREFYGASVQAPSLDFS